MITVSEKYDSFICAIQVEEEYEEYKLNCGLVTKVGSDMRFSYFSVLNLKPTNSIF